MGNKVIFVPTPQHSGTWFLLELLQGHSEVRNGVMELRDMIGPMRGEITLLHTHFGQGVTYHPNDAEKFITDKVLFELVGIHPTVITIRDPLLALITRQLRHPDLWHSYIITAFMTIVQELVNKPNVFFLPVDLYKNKSYAQRLQLLKRLFAFLKLGEEDYLKFWAAGWPRLNTVGYESAKETRRWYNNRDIDKISALFPEEYGVLKKREAILRPFLEKLGYRNLLWWEDVKEKELP